MLEAVLLPKNPSTCKPLGPGGFLIILAGCGHKSRRPDPACLRYTLSLAVCFTYDFNLRCGCVRFNHSRRCRSRLRNSSASVFCGKLSRLLPQWLLLPGCFGSQESASGPGTLGLVLRRWRQGSEYWVLTNQGLLRSRNASAVSGRLSVRPGLKLKLERESDGSTLPIEVSSVPHESWRLYQFSIPSSWQGKTVRLLAEDRAVTNGGWFALTRPEPGEAIARSSHATQVIWPLLLSFLLIALTFYAGCFLAAQLGCRNIVALGLSGLAAVGLNGYLAFWLWFFSPAAGRSSNLLLPCCAAVYLVQSFRKLDRQRRQVLKELSLPLGLAGATALLVVSTGFLYGGLEDPFQTAGARFSHRCPPDNTIPYLFAEGLVNGHVKRPLLADWL